MSERLNRPDSMHHLPYERLWSIQKDSSFENSANELTESINTLSTLNNHKKLFIDIRKYLNISKHSELAICTKNGGGTKAYNSYYDGLFTSDY